MVLPVRAGERRRSETPNATMTTLASPTLGATAALSMWQVEMAAGAQGPPHVFDSEQVRTVLEGQLAAVVAGEESELRAGDTVVSQPARSGNCRQQPTRGCSSAVTDTQPHGCLESTRRAERRPGSPSRCRCVVLKERPSSQEHSRRCARLRSRRGRGVMGRGGQLARNPHVTADNSRRQKHSTSSKPASRSALSSTSSGKYRSPSDHAAKWPRACASVMP